MLRVVAAVGAAVSGLASIACLGLWLAVTQLHAFQSVVPSAGEEPAVVCALLGFYPRVLVDGEPKRAV